MCQKKLRSWNKDFTYVCDPVMGDEGRLYVQPDIVEGFRQHIVPLASVIVPNQYEAELLTEGSISSVDEGFGAAAKLHERGPHTVIITSMLLADRPDEVLLLASTTRPQAGGPEQQQLVMSIPRINAYFTGTGDLLAALLLARLHHHQDHMTQAVDRAVAGLQAVLIDTATQCGPAALAAERTSEVCNARELRLIQNQDALRDPQVKLHCVTREQYRQQQAR
mmetsp:Transcript_8791/g.18788  ORF Transcript_8791/g.18788 Transcript_8791/m.18788 type:complete len:222 (-) Transcript_8791:204-869(-)